MNRYSLRKRKQVSYRDQNPKRPKPSAQKASKMKLTNVNNDCLERIFLHLSVQDLLNIAHSNKRLKAAADLAFGRNFGGKKSKVVINSRCFQIESNGNSAQSIELRNPYRLLRSFGHLISNLVIHTRKVVPYVNQYCCESATEVTFFEMSKDDFMQKPFMNVEMVCINFCNLKGKSMQLHHCFPKMHTLKLIHVESQPKCIETHYPHLVHLEIEGPIPTPTIKSTINILSLNPQLRRLTLDTNYTTEFLRTASQRLRSLEHLDIRCWPKDLSDFGEDVANFAGLKVLKITSFDILKIKIPIVSSCLQEFSLSFRFSIHYNNKNIIDFLNQHSSIIKLSLASEFWLASPIDEEFVKRIMKAVPLVEEIEFHDVKITADGVIQLVKDYKLLKKLRFVMRCSFDWGSLKANLGIGWEVTEKVKGWNWYIITAIKLSN
ncbi:uncharacterized protein LOC116336964 [Contarinia nasturtii]|uniref:uncharacterized protein LOC116336964 n=1 Tax=Contarinia nasturtii TaxID=265458 RepID=UPI0012D37390|nr:uncharacterized protein LOC116336964 [Contarinia nasturtii]